MLHIICLHQWIFSIVKRPSVSTCCWGGAWWRQYMKQIGRRSAYQFWLLPSSLWHVLLVRSLKPSACLSKHTPPQYIWLKCDWRSQCRAKLATQRLCWVMLITQTRCECSPDGKQHIMQAITSQEIWELWIHYGTAEMKLLQTTLLWHNLSFCLPNLYLGTLHWAPGIYCTNRAEGRWRLFDCSHEKNISVFRFLPFACI